MLDTRTEDLPLHDDVRRLAGRQPKAVELQAPAGPQANAAW
jgi:hypothetical protein